MAHQASFCHLALLALLTALTARQGMATDVPIDWAALTNQKQMQGRFELRSLFHVEGSRADSSRQLLPSTCISSCVLSLAAPPAAGLPAAGPGDGTSYGLGQDYQGSCSYGSAPGGANTNTAPAWRNGIDMTVAMNGLQFANASLCGACISFIGLGSGIGTSESSPCVSDPDAMRD